MLQGRIFYLHSVSDMISLFLSRNSTYVNERIKPCALLLITSRPKPSPLRVKLCLPMALRNFPLISRRGRCVSRTKSVKRWHTIRGRNLSTTPRKSPAISALKAPEPRLCLQRVSRRKTLGNGRTRIGRPLTCPCFNFAKNGECGNFASAGCRTFLHFFACNESVNL